MKNREKEIIKVSGIGIGSNVLLASFKAGVGLFTGSVAIVMDAVNNLSDVLSSVITIVGTKLASRKPDKKHPMGHGRIEYISATIIAFIVLMAGVAAFEQSVKAIIRNEPAHYDVWAFVIMGVAIVVKLVLGYYTKRKGVEVQSQSLVASGTDAMFDAIITVTTVVSALLMVIWDVNVDGWLGALIALVIIKAGFEILRDTLDDILGHRMSAEQSHSIKDAITQYPGVMGAYDLLVSDYGPNKQVGMVHIEVDENMTAREIYRLTNQISTDLYMSQHVYLTIGVYPLNSDPMVKEMHERIVSKLMEESGVLGIHAFYVNQEAMRISFDAVISFDVDDQFEFVSQMKEKIKTLYPDYDVVINIDYDISD